MRKLVVSMNVTLDGYMSGPDCELDWHFKYWNDELADALGMQLNNADTILLGRVTYNAMARHWPAMAQRIDIPRGDMPFADMMNSYTKVVYSKTINEAYWGNTILMQGNLSQQIKVLKQQQGKDVIVYGSSKLVYALTELNLVDEYVLWVHPVALGKGKPVFNPSVTVNIALENTRTFGSGVVMMRYNVL